MAESSSVMISAIVSTYNSERFIAGRLQDLEDQTIADQIEIIVIDSGSQQDEKAIVAQFQQRYSNIKYLRTERETIYAAWNRGIAMAAGKYLTNANADDRLRPDAFEIMLQTLEGSPDIALVYADVVVTHEENEIFGNCHPSGVYCWSDFNLRQLFTGCFVGPQPMWRRDLHAKYGEFDSEYVSAGDYEFWLRAARSEQFLHIQEPLGLYYESIQSLAHINAERAKEETIRAREKYWDKAWGELPAIQFDGLAGIKRYARQFSPPKHLVNNILQSLPLLPATPLVSVILPTLNRPLLLADAIGSVMDQSYDSLEVIVVNDGGEDISNIIESYNDPRIRWVDLPNTQGPSVARNTGLAMSRGAVICLLDDDDIFHQDHIRSLVEVLREKNTPFVYADGYCIEEVVEDGQRTELERRHMPYEHDQFDNKRLYVFSYIPASCWGFRRECLTQIGYFDTDLLLLEDWEWLLRLTPYCTLTHVKKSTVMLRNRKNISEQRATLYRPLLGQTYNKICQKHRSDVLIEENEQRNRYLSQLHYEYQLNQLFEKWTPQ